jgi:alpha-1,3-rhamnosyl/mannosyltransferase
MKIAIDATPLSVPTGGIRRYTQELAAALCRAGDEVDLLGATGLLARRWWLCGLPLTLRRGGYDVFHGTDFSVPYVPICPAVMTIHDMEPFRAGRPAAVSRRITQRTPALLRLGLATMIVTPSEAVRRQVIEHFRISPTRVVAVPLAAPDVFRPRPASPGAPYLLHAGTLEPRKNLRTLIAAWREIRHEHAVDLVLAGRVREDFGEIEPGEGLRLTGVVTDEELASLYSGALAVVVPSLYEGFGLPVLEAMQCGAPVIVSPDAAVREAAGDAALMAPGFDVRSWVEVLERFLAIPAHGERLREAGLRRAAHFGWAETARKIREVYQEAVSRFAR